jgi:hypothetical protein
MRAESLACDAAARPYRSTFAILTLNLTLIAVLIPVGAVLFDDPAELFREARPATWLSFVELTFIAVVAWAIQARVSGRRRLRLDSFWGLSAAVFAVIAFVEITDVSHFVADLVTAAGAATPGGFHDLDAFLLTIVFLGAGVALLRYARDALPHRGTVLLLGIGVLLGAAMQTLDSLLAVSSAEFVAEESLKLAAEPFLIGGYLVALHAVLEREPETPAA